MGQQTEESELVGRFAAWQRGRGFSDKTITRRTISIGRFRAHMHPRLLEAATGVDVEDWLGQLRSPATRRAYRADLNSFYRWANRRHLLAGNPIDDTDSIRVPRSLPRPVAAALLPAILAAAAMDLRQMIALAAYAGLRVSEIANIERGDLQLGGDDPVVIVRQGKGQKDRVVPAHPELVRILGDRTKPGRLFTVSAATVGDQIARHLRDLGINATAHKLRHTFGTEAVRAANGNIVLAAYLMGHESIDTTMRYNGWAGGPGSEVIRKMYPAA